MSILIYFSHHATNLFSSFLLFRPKPVEFARVEAHVACVKIGTVKSLQ